MNKKQLLFFMVLSLVVLGFVSYLQIPELVGTLGFFAVITFICTTYNYLSDDN